MNLSNCKITAIICRDLSDFNKWAKTRRLKKYNKYYFIDNEKELYAPIYLYSNCYGMVFDDYEMTEGCIRLDLEREVKLRIKNN